jgi:hypothetical protein
MEPAVPAIPPQPEEPSQMPAEPAEPEASPGFGPSDEPDGIDDLFGPSPGGDTAPPAAPPAPPAPSESPAQPTTEEPSEEPSANDLFGEPAEADFGEPVDDGPGVDTVPDAGEERDDEEDVDLDDLFGQADSVLCEPGGLASDDLRLWVDNTGRYSCRGRMVEMLDGQVRLLKDNGRTATVPLSRLSDADLEFVNRQASAHMAGTIAGTTSVAPIPLAN